MKSYSDFNGKDFEQLMIDHGFVTDRGFLDREAVACFLGICKRTVGNMMNGRITKLMYLALALHTRHLEPALDKKRYTQEEMKAQVERTISAISEKS